MMIKMIQHIKTTNLNLCYLYTKKTKFNTEIRHYKPTSSSCGRYRYFSNN